MFDVLQIGRAFAALAVCAFHLSVVLSDPRFDYPSPFARFTSQGYLGVDFFFALSGFIILFAHRQDIGQPRQLIPFALKRFIRIYPFYWFFSAVVLIGAAASRGINRPPQNTADVFSVISLVRVTDFEPAVRAAWTLFHEVFFYALFAVAIWRRRVGMVMFVLWALVIVAAPMVVDTANLGAFMDMLVAPVNIGFFAGMAAFVIFGRLSKRMALAALLAGVGLFSIWLRHDWQADEQVAAKACLGVCFTLILSGAVALEKAGTSFNFPLLLLIGDASFILYLTHENVQSMCLKLMERLAPGFLTPAVIYAAILLLCVLLAVALYTHIEQRTLNVLKRLLLVRRRPRRVET